MTQTKFREIIFKNNDLICIICIIIVCLIFLSPYIFSNPTPLIFPVSDLGTDLDRDVLPNIEYIVNTIKATGEIPLWRDYLLSGAPLVGHPSIPIFYPLYWIMLFIPIPLGLNLIALVNLSWMGVGMYLYLRKTGGNKPIPSLLGGIAMALSPKWIAHLSGGHWFMLTALAWTPWAFIIFDKYWKSRKITWLFLLAIVLASIAVNFFPNFIIICSVLAFINITNFSPNQLYKEIKIMVSAWSVVAILTLGLVSSQILPLIELLPHAIHTTDNSTFTSLHPIALLAGIFPPDLKYPEWFLIPGLIVLLFACLSWAYGWNQFDKKWGVIGLIGLVLSLGEFTPLYSWLFGWNPLGSVLRVPTRWWLLTIFAIIVLCSKGINYWIEKKQHLNSRAKLVVSFFLLIEILAGGLKIFLGENFPFDTIPTAIIAILLCIILTIGHFRPRTFLPYVLILLLIVEFMVIGHSLIRPQEANSAVISRDIVKNIKSTLSSDERIFSPGDGFPPLALIRGGINASQGYDALPLENYLKFIRIATGCPLVQEAIGSQAELEACLNPNVMQLDWLKLINVRLLVVRDGEDWHIKNLSPGFGRVFSIEKIAKTSNDTCLDDLKMIDSSKIVLIECEIIDHQIGKMKILSQERGVNNEIFNVSVVDSPVLLIRSENWAPGWKATVDGQPVNVNKVNCVLQGVWVEEGKHIVEFSYKPFGYPIGFWISTLTLIGLIILTIIFFFKKTHVS